MTRDKWKERLPIIQAFADGKTVQYLDGSKWSDLHNDACFVDKNALYRIKPEPKLRPWKPEEVPVGASFRYGSEGLPTAWIDTTPTGLILGLFCPGRTTSYGELAERWQYSIDHGKTWLSCGVVE